MQTIVDEVPTAICPFQGRVLIGVGKLLRIYDLGKKKLLRKCENKVFGFVSSNNNILVKVNYNRHVANLCALPPTAHPELHRWHPCCRTPHTGVWCTGVGALGQIPEAREPVSRVRWRHLPSVGDMCFGGWLEHSGARRQVREHHCGGFVGRLKVSADNVNRYQVHHWLWVVLWKTSGFPIISAPLLASACHMGTGFCFERWMFYVRLWPQALEWWSSALNHSFFRHPVRFQLSEKRKSFWPTAKISSSASDNIHR